MNIIERLFSKTKLNGTCIEWVRFKDAQGYGRFAVNKESKRANRVVYELCKGTIGKDLHVCHSCDNPSCINPNHLWLGTNADNMRDKIAKGLSGKQRFCVKGHDKKLTGEYSTGRCKQCHKIYQAT